MNLNGTKTQKNLLAAFAGESMARTRYNIYSKIADDQNCHLVAEKFNETAQNEFAHATRIFSFLNSFGNTEDNLSAAAIGEREEWSSLYKKAAEDAYDEGFDEIGKFFDNIASIEKNHEERFLSLQTLLQNNKMFNGEENSYWICANCGYVHKGPQPPENCDVCGYPRGYFSKTDKS